jgi:hypothetical protein
MRRFPLLSRSLVGVAAISLLTLTGCSGTQEAARDAGEKVGDAAKTAVDTAGGAAKTAVDTAGDAAKTAADTAGDAAKTAGDAAKTAATATGQAALAPAVNPVLDLLKKSEGEVKGGKLAQAVTAMGGFAAAWKTAAPVIQPLAGDKWPQIEGAANLVLSTFAKGANPTEAAAGSALTGLIGPLSALMGK